MSFTEQRMSDFLDEARAILNKTTAQVERMQTLTDLNEKQLLMYKENTEKAIEASDRRWTGLRNSLISIIVFVLGSVFVGGSTINDKVDKKEVEAMIDKEDAASRTDVIRGINQAIDDTFDYLERKDVGDHDEITIESTEMKLNAYKEITGYKTRSITKE